MKLIHTNDIIGWCYRHSCVYICDGWNTTFVSYLNNTFKCFMALLICSCFLKVLANAHVLPEEHLAMLLQPIKNLFDIFLKKSESKSLVQLDLLGVPLLLKCSMIGKDVMDDIEDMTGSLLIVSCRVYWLRRRSGILEKIQDQQLVKGSGSKLKKPYLSLMRTTGTLIMKTK